VCDFAPALSIEFSADDSLIATKIWHPYWARFSSNDVEYLVVQTDNGRLNCRIGSPTPIDEPFLSAACLDREGHLFAAFMDGANVIVRDIATGREAMRAPVLDGLGFHQLSGRLVFGTTEGNAQELLLRDMTTGEVIRKEVPFFSDLTWGYPIRASRDGEILLYVVDHGFLVYETVTRKTAIVAFSPGWQPSGKDPAMLSPDGQIIACFVCPKPFERNWFLNLVESFGVTLTTFKQGVQLYDVRTGNAFAYFPDAYCAALSHDGKTLAVANGQIELWDYPLAHRPHLLFVFLACLAAFITFAALKWRNR
jgi:hypothetical protein